MPFGRRLPAALLAASLLSACAVSIRGPKTTQLPVPASATVTRYPAGSACNESVTAMQDAICADAGLAALERDMNQAFRQSLRNELVAGRSLLLAFHRHWLLSRATACKLPVERNTTAVEPAVIDCLTQRYRQHIQALNAWSPPAARSKTTAHPLAAYVDFRLIDDREANLCTAMRQRFNEQLAGGWQIDSQSAGVERQDAGPYASYQLRAKALTSNGQRLIDEKTLARWIAQLPNAGGRFSNVSAQTGDYASIDTFADGNRQLALVSEPWGYYSPAARGEAAYAGLYELTTQGTQPRCLFQTYVTPPIAGIFDKLPAFNQLTAALEAMSGGFPAGLAPNERLDQQLLQRETLWTLLTLPLLAIDDGDRPGRQSALRQRHDAMLEAIFAWSERNPASKRLYRQLMPLIPAANAELVATFQSVHGLNASEAAAAADLLLIEAVDFAAENLTHPADAHIAGKNYRPRYAAAPAPGDLEKGRQLTTLYSAIVNRAPANVLNDFVRYEFAAPNRPRGRGASGDTALMAAVNTPPLLRQLLAAGADPNEFNAWHATALMAAIADNQLESAEALLGAGADVATATVPWMSDGAGNPDIEASAVAGRTALMIAAAQGKADVIRLLLKHNPPLSPRDAQGRSACSELERNASLIAAELAELRPLLCRVETVTVVAKPLRLGELLASGGRKLSSAEVSTMMTGRTVRGTNPDGQGTYELRFDADSTITGKVFSPQGDAPVRGRWKVDADGVLCSSTSLAIEKTGRQLQLPTQCNQFLLRDTNLYSATGSAAADEILKPLPGP